MNEKLPPLEIYPSRREIFVALVSAGVMLGMTIGLLLEKLGEKLGETVDYPFIGVFACLSVGFLIGAWRRVSSLPWQAINLAGQSEYRNPYGPSKIVSDGGETDLLSNPSRNPAAQEELER